MTWYPSQQSSYIDTNFLSSFYCRIVVAAFPVWQWEADLLELSRGRQVNKHLPVAGIKPVTNITDQANSVHQWSKQSLSACVMLCHYTVMQVTLQILLKLPNCCTNDCFLQNNCNPQNPVESLHNQ